jgi:hypothetical protein
MSPRQRARRRPCHPRRARVYSSSTVRPRTSPLPQPQPPESAARPTPIMFCPRPCPPPYAISPFHQRAHGPLPQCSTAPPAAAPAPPSLLPAPATNVPCAWSGCVVRGASSRACVLASCPLDLLARTRAWSHLPCVSAPAYRGGGRWRDPASNTNTVRACPASLLASLCVFNTPNCRRLQRAAQGQMGRRAQARLASCFALVGMHVGPTLCMPIKHGLDAPQHRQRVQGHRLQFTALDDEAEVSHFRRRRCMQHPYPRSSVSSGGTAGAQATCGRLRSWRPSPGLPPVRRPPRPACPPPRPRPPPPCRPQAPPLRGSRRCQTRPTRGPAPPRQRHR